MYMLDTKTKTLSWTPDLSGLLPTRELQSQGHFRGSVRVRACVCVCEHVCWGEGAVYRWVEERSSELHSEEAWKEEDQECGQQSSVVLETCLRTARSCSWRLFILSAPWFDLVAWLPEVLGFYLACSIWVRSIVK